MGIRLLIRRKDGFPVGPVEHLVQQLKAVFSEAQFARERDNVWYGAYQVDDLAIEFVLGKDPLVVTFFANVYGRIDLAKKHFDQLKEFVIEIQ